MFQPFFTYPLGCLTSFPPCFFFFFILWLLFCSLPSYSSLISILFPYHNLSIFRISKEVKSILDISLLLINDSIFLQLFGECILPKGMLIFSMILAYYILCILDYFFLNARYKTQDRYQHLTLLLFTLILRSS